MTVEELVELTTRLTARFTTETIVAGDHASELSDWPNHEVGLLMRFLGGERVAVRVGRPPLSFDQAVNLPERRFTLGVEPDDDEPEGGNEGPLNRARVQEAVARSERQDPDKPLVLGGDFAGVELK